jgi:hypothetical protein
MSSHTIVATPNNGMALRRMVKSLIKDCNKAMEDCIALRNGTRRCDK